MATIRINGLEAHSSPMVLTSPASALPDRASFKAIYERDDVFLAVMEGASGPGAVESPRHFFKLANTSEGIFNLKNEHKYLHPPARASPGLGGSHLQRAIRGKWGRRPADRVSRVGIPPLVPGTI